MSRLSAFPTISELRAFEAAARLRSISGAAMELRCSQPCVTHRIKSLEQRWAANLLDRTTRSVAWTPATAKVYDRVRHLLLDLEGLVSEFDLAPEARQLVITVSSAFASAWLIPRLSLFHACYPAIEVRLSATNRHVDLARESFDVGIRLLPTDSTPPPDHFSLALTDAKLVVAAGPAYAGLLGRNWTPADLATANLIWLEETQDWPRFFSRFLGTDAVPSQGSSFNNADLVIRAALENQGVALVREFLVADDLREGRLVKLVDQSINSADAYYFVVPRHRLSRPPVQQFKAWLTSAISQESAPLLPA